jgi:hypothetical protein
LSGKNEQALARPSSIESSVEVLSTLEACQQRLKQLIEAGRLDQQDLVIEAQARVAIEHARARTTHPDADQTNSAAHSLHCLPYSVAETKWAGLRLQGAVSTGFLFQMRDGRSGTISDNFVVQWHPKASEFDIDDALSAGPQVTWPHGRMVARVGDMAPPDRSHMRVMLDDDNDVCVQIWDREHGDGQLAGIEFCCPGIGGGKSPRTREALLALMAAMEEDNITEPRGMLGSNNGF